MGRKNRLLNKLGFDRKEPAFINRVRSHGSNIVHVVPSGIDSRISNILLERRLLPLLKSGSFCILFLIGHLIAQHFLSLLARANSTMKTSTLLACWVSAASAAFDLNRGGAVLKVPQGDSFASVTGTVSGFRAACEVCTN